MIDSSVFLEAYLEQPLVEPCQKLLRKKASYDTVVCDLVVGEVVLNLREAMPDREFLATAVNTFLDDLANFELIPLPPDCVSYVRKHHEFEDLRDIQDKDKLLLACAIRTGLSCFTTIDKGILNARGEITQLCRDLRVKRLAIEHPRDVNYAKR